MSNRTFWRSFALAALAAAFYIGHGLHNSRASSAFAAAPNLASPGAYAPWMGGTSPSYVTSSADGRTLYFWGEKLAPKVQDPTRPITIQAIISAPSDTVSIKDLQNATPAP